jgi:hypothetical protein
MPTTTATIGSAATRPRAAIHHPRLPPPTCPGPAPQPQDPISGMRGRSTMGLRLDGLYAAMCDRDPHFAGRSVIKRAAWAPRRTLASVVSPVSRLS